jgi:uncharacterized protein YjiS (DUF1127 family)
MSTVSEIISNVYKRIRIIGKKMWASHLVLQERRASYYILKAMTDKQLKDIGVSRSDIKQRVFDIHQ